MRSEDTGMSDQDELNLIDILQFLQRQQRTILMVFLTISILVFSFAITRPTQYQSKASIVVGERLFFQQQQQIESIDEIKYLYGDLATFNAIKNTRIVEVSATAKLPDLAKTNLQNAIQKIIQKHKQILEAKKMEFNDLLKTQNEGGVNRADFIRLLDNAASSSLTKQIGSIETTKLLHGGIFVKVFGIGVFAAIFLALIISILKDYIERSKAKPALG